jgi:hypothetical protein
MTDALNKGIVAKGVSVVPLIISLDIHNIGLGAN